VNHLPQCGRTAPSPWERGWKDRADMQLLRHHPYMCQILV
jgi:hypothetical protein